MNGTRGSGFPRRYPESPVFYRDLSRTYQLAGQAEGVWIEDGDGKRWLDACGGALAVSVGHGRAEVARAAARQLETIAFVHGTQFTTRAMEEAAAVIIESLPSGYRDAKVYLTPGGAESVETAIKLARAAAVAGGNPERRVILSQTPGYHGNTLGALATSGRPGLQAPYLPMLPEARLVAAPWCPRCPLGLAFPTCETACAGEAEAALESDGKQIAAVLVEPVLGASAGGFAPPEDYLRRIRQAASRCGIPLIADEVLTGCGRTGRFLASEHAGVEADIVVLAKGLTSGYVPGGAVVAKSWIVEAAAPAFRHGFTFSHHPVVAAVVRQVLRLIREQDLVERAAALQDDLLAALEPVAGFAGVEGVWARGLLGGIALRPPERGGMRAGALAEAAFREGLLVYPTGGPPGQGDVVLLAPPLIIRKEELAEIGRRLLAAFDS